MKVPQVPILEYAHKVIPPSTGDGVFDNDDAAKGMCLVQRAALADNGVAAALSTAADEDIIGVLGDSGEQCYPKGILIFAATTAMAAADLGKGIATTTTTGKIAAATTGGFGRIIGGGTDSEIGHYRKVLN